MRRRFPRQQDFEFDTELFDRQEAFLKSLLALRPIKKTPPPIPVKPGLDFGLPSLVRPPRFSRLLLLLLLPSPLRSSGLSDRPSLLEPPSSADLEFHLHLFRRSLLRLSTETGGLAGSSISLQRPTLMPSSTRPLPLALPLPWFPSLSPRPSDGVLPLLEPASSTSFPWRCLLSLSDFETLATGSEQIIFPFLLRLFPSSQAWRFELISLSLRSLLLVLSARTSSHTLKTQDPDPSPL